MLSHSEAVRLVAFHAVPNPEQWVLGDEPAYLVVTKKNWSIYYSSPPKDADFDACIYLVASLGIKPNPGYSIRILQVEQLKARITTRIQLMKPDPRKIYPQVVVRRVATVAVAKTSLELHHLQRFVFVDQKGKSLAAIKTET